MPCVASLQFQGQQLGLQKRHVTHARATPSVQPSGLPALLRRAAACRSQGAQRRVAVAAAAPDPLPPRNSTNGALPTTLSTRVLGQIDRVTLQTPEEVPDVLASSDILREALVGDDFKERDRKLLRTVGAGPLPRLVAVEGPCSGAWIRVLTAGISFSLTRTPAPVLRGASPNTPAALAPPSPLLKQHAHS